jgi:NAD-dependent SIR2 family protein deacetylase
VTAFNSLQEFVERHRRRFVLTRAGCSTNFGIPDYRDVDGNWKQNSSLRDAGLARPQTARLDRFGYPI